MNKRMLELYAQTHVPSTAIDPSNNMPYETTCFSADKFSELIVQECVNRCEDIGSFLHSVNMETGDGAFSCAADLKKHFGVEE